MYDRLYANTVKNSSRHFQPSNNGHAPAKIKVDFALYRIVDLVSVGDTNHISCIQLLHYTSYIIHHHTWQYLVKSNHSIVHFIFDLSLHFIIMTVSKFLSVSRQLSGRNTFPAMLKVLSTDADDIFTPQTLQSLKISCTKLSCSTL